MTIKWCDRSLLRCGYLALCLTQKTFEAELRKLKIPHAERPAFVVKDAAAHFFISPKGTRVVIVAINVGPDHTLAQVIALLVHEGVHIWQDQLQYMDEKAPGSEVEAYAIQAIAQELMTAYLCMTGRAALTKKGSARG